MARSTLAAALLLAGLAVGATACDTAGGQEDGDDGPDGPDDDGPNDDG
jgi:hypothetical protein